MVVSKVRVKLEEVDVAGTCVEELLEEDAELLVCVV